MEMKYVRIARRDMKTGERFRCFGPGGAEAGPVLTVIDACSEMTSEGKREIGRFNPNGEFRVLREAVVATPAGPIAIVADPTLKPGEWRLGTAPQYGYGADFGSGDETTGIVSVMVNKSNTTQPMTVRAHAVSVDIDIPIDRVTPAEITAAFKTLADAHDAHEVGKITVASQDPDRWILKWDAEIRLSTKYDRVTLRTLLAIDAENRADTKNAVAFRFTPAQRAAVSAHWSAELRAKVKASAKADAERERNRVVMEHDVEDEPWR